MKILILGATGRTGKLILEKALANGFEVNILVRYPEKITLKSEKLTIFEGLSTNIEALKEAIKDCKSVISALNISRTTDFPWSALRTPKDFLTKTIQNIIDLSKNQELEKIIVISAWGVAETKKDIPFWFRFLIEISNIKFGYLGHEQSELLLQKSNLNWTSVRPTGLTNFKKIKPIIITQNNSPQPNLTISRNNTANFIIKILEQKTFNKQTVTISE